jgi:H+/Cl- antiporter ClcA
MAEGTGRGEMLSIWFFVGVMTLAYGLVLLPYGAWEWFGGHEAQTVLHELHPTFWWGALLTVFGGFYSIRFRPRSGDTNKA